MTSGLASVPLFAVAALVAIAIGAIAGAGVVVVLRQRVAACAPRERHAALLLLAAVPLVGGATLTIAASLPSVVALAIPGLDHCTAHDDGHAHLCFRHVPAGISPTIAALLVVVVAYASIRLARAALRARRTRRVLGSLLASGERDVALDVTIVESTLPICMAAGFLRPRVLVARALLDRLPILEREIVLTHERAHLERRDPLLAVLARALCAFHVPPIRRWLLAELAIAAEQACDDVAARRVDDRVAVAATILAIHRDWSVRGVAAVGAAGLGFAMHALERRVESLLAEPSVGPSLVVHRRLGLAIVLLTLASSSLLHHWTEAVVSHVAL